MNKLLTVGILLLLFAGLLFAGKMSGTFAVTTGAEKPIITRVDVPGTHIEDALNNPDTSIDVSLVRPSPLSILAVPFAIAPMKEGVYTSNFYPGETVNLHIDVTSYNVPCKRTYIIAEIYDPSKIRSSKSKWIGELPGGNNYFIADLSYNIPSTETNYGTWSASGYMWCDDTNLADIDGNGKTGSGEVISRAYRTSFSVLKVEETCDAGYVGEKTCRSSFAGHEDVFQLYRKTNCTTEYRIVQDCRLDEYCAAGGQCLKKSICGDEICEGDETSSNCPEDCEKPAVECDTGEKRYKQCADGSSIMAFACDNNKWVTTTNICPIIEPPPEPEPEIECGNGECEAGESASNCQEDCGVGDGHDQEEPRCDNGVCEPPDENQYTCPEDCGPIDLCENTVCDDGLECSYDYCEGGECFYDTTDCEGEDPECTADLDCDDADPCTEDYCEMEFGICGNIPVVADSNFDCIDDCTGLGIEDCGVTETDSDGDGIPDNVDQCPLDFAKTLTGCPKGEEPPDIQDFTAIIVALAAIFGVMLTAISVTRRK